jgi:hypothetical protein
VGEGLTGEQSKSLCRERLCGRLDRDLSELIADTPGELVPRAWCVSELLDLAPKTRGQRDVLMREHSQRSGNRELRFPESVVSIDGFTRPRHGVTQRRRKLVNTDRHNQILTA